MYKNSTKHTPESEMHKTALYSTNCKLESEMYKDCIFSTKFVLESEMCKICFVHHKMYVARMYNVQHKMCMRVRCAKTTTILALIIQTFKNNYL